MVVLTIGKNSYGSLAESNTHLDGSIRAAANWLGVTPDDKRRSLISAYRQIEAQVFNGTSTGVTIIDLASINAGGTGYTKGDMLAISGGTAGEGAIVEATAVASGVVTGITLVHAGTYSVEPAATAAATTGGTGGDDCTVDLTFMDQVSDLPRTGLVDCDGRALDSTTYPTIVKEAQFLLAYMMSQDVDLEDSTGSGTNVKRVKAGSAEVEFFRPEGDNMRFPVQVWELISCLLASSSAAAALLGGFRGGAGDTSFFDTYPDDFDLNRGY